MEPERAFPPPSFPTSLNGFYKTGPKNFREQETRTCAHQDTRDYISRQVILKRRFPRLEFGPASSSVSPIKNPGYLNPTDEIICKKRSLSPMFKPKTFVPINHSEAKKISNRKVSIFEGNPYDDPKEQSFKEHKESVKKRINGEFKNAMKGKFLHDNKAYLNSLNTFDTFSSVYSGKEKYSISLFR